MLPAKQKLTLARIEMVEELKRRGIRNSAGGPFVPPPLLEQLAVNGRLVIPVGKHPHLQMLVRYVKDDANGFTSEPLGSVAFVPLIGSEGWGDKRNRSYIGEY